MTMAMQIKVDRLEKQVSVLREDVDRLCKAVERQDAARGPGRPPKEVKAA